MNKLVLMLLFHAISFAVCHLTMGFTRDSANHFKCNKKPARFSHRSISWIKYKRIVEVSKINQFVHLLWSFEAKMVNGVSCVNDASAWSITSTGNNIRREYTFVASLSGKLRSCIGHTKTQLVLPFRTQFWMTLLMFSTENALNSYEIPIYR